MMTKFLKMRVGKADFTVCLVVLLPALLAILSRHAAYASPTAEAVRLTGIAVGIAGLKGAAVCLAAPEPVFTKAGSLFFAVSAAIGGVVGAGAAVIDAVVDKGSSHSSSPTPEEEGACGPFREAPNGATLGFLDQFHLFLLLVRTTDWPRLAEIEARVVEGFELTESDRKKVEDADRTLERASFQGIAAIEDLQGQIRHATRAEVEFLDGFVVANGLDEVVARTVELLRDDNRDGIPDRIGLDQEARVDLVFTKEAHPNTLSVGDELTYRLRVRNDGPSIATGVVVTDKLLAGVKFVSASSGCSRSGSTVTCKIGNMRDGESAVRLIRVRPTAPGGFSNTATVTANETDPTPGNNTATTVTTVR